jgi:AraC family transcriptional regulator
MAMQKHMIRPEDLVTVEAQAQSEAARIQLTRFHVAEPLDDLLRIRDGFRLDLSLTPRPRNARARYCDRWGPNRFERIGQLFLIRKGERLHARNEPCAGHGIACHFEPKLIDAWFGEELAWPDPCLEASLDINAPVVKSLLMRMGEEVRHPGFAHQVMLDSTTIQLAIELRRYFTRIGVERASGGLAAWRLALIDERLATLASIPELSELADLCSMSVRQLTRAFRVSRGCSIAEHIAQKRIAQAKQLLAEGMPIKLIAHSLGFASQANFSYAFRLATGLTPRQYREQLYARA